MKVDLNSRLAQRVRQLKFDTATSVLFGDFKKARESHKELAKIGLDYFELAVAVPNPVQGQFSLFSKEGWNAFKFIISEKFRKKTPEEIKFVQMCKLYKEGHLNF